ncbi:proto-oncogene Mas-like [Pantherophis guttatus]|uniref:Proto-oncogene Mas-like n=1 Tax=Pantherophis guttatus TaxID=94885 RepID=A0ABM3YXW5_PANGU|nr:proto-oncogene Mas-like [Pantherophis guttatus]
MDDDSHFKSGIPQDDETIRSNPEPLSFGNHLGIKFFQHSFRGAYNNVSTSPYDVRLDNLTRNLINGFIAIICVLGLIGNGRTIYILTKSIKRNSFTTFILNLSIADFGVLTFLIIAAIFVVVSLLGHGTHLVKTIQFLVFELLFFTYSASQFLLMAISLDRCAAALFPLWHRCHRPPYFSKLVCIIIWILSFLLSMVHFILYQISSSPLLFQLIVNGLLCTPVMIVSTVTLLIHMRSKLQHNQRKLLTATLLALLCFLLLSLPINAFYVVEYLDPPRNILMTIGFGCASLNSSINPLLYFLVGRKKREREQPRTSFKVALQRVFKDEQDREVDQESLKEDKV